MKINDIYSLVFETEQSNTEALTDVPAQCCVDFLVELVQLLKDLDVKKVNPQILAFFKLITKNLQPLLASHFGETSPWCLKVTNGKYFAQYCEEKAEKLGIKKDEPKVPEVKPKETGTKSVAEGIEEDKEIDLVVEDDEKENEIQDLLDNLIFDDYDSDDYLVSGGKTLFNKYAWEKLEEELKELGCSVKQLTPEQKSQYKENIDDEWDCLIGSINEIKKKN